MPFAITCPACQNVFRTKTEREIGKGVQCAKCGEQFFVSADNQKAVTDETEPARPKRSRRDDDSDMSPRNKRRTENDGHSEFSAPPPKKRARVMIFMFIPAAALVFMALACGGVYLYFFHSASEPPSSVAARLKPTKELPAELFLYAVQKTDSQQNDFQLRYFDLTRRDQRRNLVELKREFEKYVPLESGIRFEDASAFSLSFSGDRAQVVAAVLFTDPRNVDDVAKSWGMSAQTVEGKQVFQKTGKGAFQAPFTLFQSSPNCVVIASNCPRERLKYIVSRSPASSKFMVDHLGTGEAVKSVSGYSTIIIENSSVGWLPNHILTVSGREPNANGQIDVLRVAICNSPPKTRTMEAAENLKGKSAAADMKHWAVQYRGYSFYETKPTAND